MIEKKIDLKTTFNIRLTRNETKAQKLQRKHYICILRLAHLSLRYENFNLIIKDNWLLESLDFFFNFRKGSLSKLNIFSTKNCQNLCIASKYSFIVVSFCDLASSHHYYKQLPLFFYISCLTFYFVPSILRFLLNLNIGHQKVLLLYFYIASHYHADDLVFDSSEYSFFPSWFHLSSDSFLLLVICLQNPTKFWDIFIQ